jgi:hypothetical protein
MKLTPLKLTMLLDIYCMANFYKQRLDLNFPAQKAALKEFQELYLIQYDCVEQTLHLTKAGQHLIDKVLEVTL